MTEKPATRASQAPPAPGTLPPDPESHPARADASQGRTEPGRVPSGCRYCGLPERGHFQRWASPHGWHTWEPPTGDLRERLTEALVEHARRESRRKGIKLSHFLETTIRATAESRAAAVLPVVEAETAALRQRAEQAEAAVQRVRRLQEMTIASSCRAGAIEQAEDTLRLLDQPKEEP